MNDEIEGEETPKKARGWPKGKKRVKKMRPDWNGEALASAPAAKADSLISKMKARPNWESENFSGPNQNVYVNPLQISEEITDALFRDGIALQWVTKSVRGMETPQELSAMTRGGWTPVHQSDFDGRLDGMFMERGVDAVIEIGDCQLVARPAAMQQKAKMQERRDAASPVARAEMQVTEGIPHVRGGQHSSIRNQINKSFERVEIPEI